tara:strand:- start:1125 stop:1958 length:834 start_codon:yes stop_codon:yes gene_type:complete
MKKLSIEQRKALLKKCQINPLEVVKYPPIAISLGNMVLSSKKGNEVVKVPIGTYGNFSFVQAPPKSKKTFFISLLSAAYLGDNHFSGDIKGNRNGKSLIHFDTEQSDFHSARVFRRAVDMSSITEKYYTFALRELSYFERIQVIEQSLDQIKDVGLVIIDGIADLVSDVNDLEQSNECVQHLMKWTARHKCHIITVIHSNFGTSKPTGHLGSFLEKKCETQIELELNTVHKDRVNVSCKRSRGFPFEKFSFKVNKIGLPEVIEDNYDLLKNFKSDSR